MLVCHVAAGPLHGQAAWQVHADSDGHFLRVRRSHVRRHLLPATFETMCGDNPHDSMLFGAGLYLFWNVLSQPALYMARSMLIQMSILSVLAGLMYNDMFSVGLPLFECRWEDSDRDWGFTPKEGVDVKNEGTGQ